MNSIKNTIVTVTLLTVGYGTYVVLSEPVPPGVAQQGTDAVWDAQTGAEGDPTLEPEVTIELPAAAGAEAPSIPPASELLATSEGQPTGPPSAASTGAMEAPDPLSVPADNLNAPPADHATTDAADGASGAAPWPVELAPPSGTAGPSQSAAPTSSPPPATNSDGSYYARQTNPPPPAAYPETSTPTSPASAGHPGFEETWKSVQTNLQNGQLADALFTLTVWYEAPTLSGEQSQRCIQLLDQLAGTVIYSRESFLENAHVVQEGETLATIAEQYSVPQEFLARINGIGPSFELHPGESLKVLRGPFRAEISRSRNELTVFLGRYYAGRFPVRLGPELPAGDNLYEVIAKENGKEFFDRRTGDRITLSDPRNPYGDRWIGLRGEQITAAHNVGLHVDNNSAELGCIALGRVDADDLSVILSLGSRVAVKP